MLTEFYDVKKRLGKNEFLWIRMADIKALYHFPCRYIHYYYILCHEIESMYYIGLYTPYGIEALVFKQNNNYYQRPFHDAKCKKYHPEDRNPRPA